ncbi:MAG: hypothetical protein ACFFD7_06565 [Candidatus Thorarchaeota archaeon]
MVNVLIFSLNFNLVNAVDEDNDQVSDEFEELNKRNVEADIYANEVHINSIRRSDKKKDQIGIDIFYNENGLGISFNYRSKLELSPEFAFSIVFQEIIEFIDIEEDGIYNPEVDQKIQNYSITNFKPINYTEVAISNDSSYHYFKISTINNTFNAHIYVAEEFAIINDSLITPNQLKIDVEISNFTYNNTNSNLALYTKLESETNYEFQEITEDETLGYAENEQGVITSFEGRIGFLTWKRFATINDVLQEVPISDISLDDKDENEQKIYLNYNHGDHIFHDPKIGIEDLLISLSEPPNPILILVVLLIVGALGVSVIYTVYHFEISGSPDKKIKKEREEHLKEIFDEDEIIGFYKETSPLQIFLGENSVEKLIQIRHLNITVVSEDFYEIVDSFKWEGKEKENFIQEMLALNPKERKLILDEMIEKSGLLLRNG